METVLVFFMLWILLTIIGLAIRTDVTLKECTQKMLKIILPFARGRRSFRRGGKMQDEYFLPFGLSVIVARRAS